MGFIVTNLDTDNRAVVRFYNQRGTAEQWIKEGKQALKITRAVLPSLPVERGAAGVERDCLQPGEPVAAAGTAEEDRELVADEFAATVGEDRRTTGKHARYYWLLLAEGHLNRRRFAAMLRRIFMLPVPAG